MTQENPVLMDYLQRALGYSLVGSTREKAVFFLYGPSGTGKTTLLTAFRDALGEDYGTLIQITTLLAGRDNNATNADLADLCGVRFAMTSEPESGAKLSPSKIKRITQGMGKIKARRLYENPFAFEETHALWVDCNDRPTIPNADPATFARLHPIPFLRPVPKEEVDRTLIAKLREERPGILAWAAEGTRRWIEQGLGRPEEVAMALDEWRSECDDIAQFIAEKCGVGEEFFVGARRLYTAYKAWSQDRREEPMTETAFGRQMRQRFAKDHTEKGWFYRGITVNEHNA